MTRTPEVVLSRGFSIEPSRVFDAWTNAAQLSSWMRPMGLPLIASKLDLAVGGTYHYGLRENDGREIWGKWVFRELAPPKRVSFVISFSDKSGGIRRHPYLESWPLEILCALDLVEENGATLMKFSLEPINASASEVKGYSDGRGALEQVWGEMFDELEKFVDK